MVEPDYEEYVSFVKKVLPSFVGAEERIFVSAMFFVVLSPRSFIQKLHGISVETFVELMISMDTKVGHSTIVRVKDSDQLSNTMVFDYFYEESVKHDDWFNMYVNYVCLWKNSDTPSSSGLLESIVSIDSNTFSSCDVNTLLSLIGVSNHTLLDSTDTSVVCQGDYFVVNIDYGGHPKVVEKECFIATETHYLSNAKTAIDAIYPFDKVECDPFGRYTHSFDDEPSYYAFRATEIYESRNNLEYLGFSVIHESFHDPDDHFDYDDPIFTTDDILPSNTLITEDHIVT